MPTDNPALEYLNAIYRQLLLATCIFAVGAALTVWAVRVLPDLYRSTTLIMVEAQDVPDAFVKTTVTTRLEARLNALSQEVLSRTRLEGIIKDFDLAGDLGYRSAPMERAVEAMRARIKTEVFASDNAFRISYEGSNPVLVQRVTARLAGLYIDENLKIREEHVSGTTEFLENELEKAKQQIQALDTRIQAFKQEHMGELPEQRDANMRALEGLRLQLQTVSMALSSAKERKVALDTQAEQARAVRSAKPGQGGQPAADPRTQLRELQAQQAALRARYTSKHPDLVNLQRAIDELRGELASEAAGAGPALDPFVPPELARARLDTGLEIARLTQEKDNITNAITTYQLRVENTFVREQELLDLTRDYAVTQKQYQSMLDKKLEAQLSQSLERRQKGERFRVLDPANLPQYPVRPNRSLLTLVGIGGSLLAALGLPILLAQLDTSFHVADEVAACAAPVLAVVREVPTPAIRRRQRRYRSRVLGLSALALIVGLGTISFYARYLF